MKQKLLLLALTHRLCSVYTRKLIAEKDFRKPQARYIYPSGAINRTILYERAGGGLLRGQAMPVAQIPLRPLQIHLRIHGTGAGIQVHYPQKHFTTQEYTKERTGNLRFLQLPGTHPISALSSRNRLECRHSNTAERKETSYRYYAFSRITKRLPFPNSL